MTQAVTLLAHARELLDEQRGRGGAALPTGAPGAPGAPKQTMQTEIRSLTHQTTLPYPIHPLGRLFFTLLSEKLSK